MFERSTVRCLGLCRSSRVSQSPLMFERSRSRSTVLYGACHAVQDEDFNPTSSSDEEESAAAGGSGSRRRRGGSGAEAGRTGSCQQLGAAGVMGACVRSCSPAQEQLMRCASACAHTRGLQSDSSPMGALLECAKRFDCIPLSTVCQCTRFLPWVAACQALVPSAVPSTGAAACRPLQQQPVRTHQDWHFASQP